MELKQLCKTLNIDRSDDWSTAKYLSTCAYLESSTNISPSTVYAALTGSHVIAMADRLAIVDSIRQAKAITGWRQIPVTLKTIDWLEAPDTRTWTEKTADFQEEQNRRFIAARTGYTTDRDTLNREERARRALIAIGGI